ncbi:replication initiation factor domain-containing protein [Roseateles microcysteis]|uniref:replication initiation factor domain-containing protein n=1 Tax=Roseateles microcysteis TaxID=3119057 RepID=UPI002FE67F56
MRTEARPVLAGRHLKWTLEQRQAKTGWMVHIDWLRFTVPLDAIVKREPALVDLTALDLLEQSARDVVRMAAGVECAEYTSAHKVAEAGARLIASLLDCGIEPGEALEKGMDFYSARAPLVFAGETVGFVLAGGKATTQSGTVHVNLFGSAMLHVPVDRLDGLREFLVANDGNITRVDLALDVFEGRCIDEVRMAYLAGDFDVRGKRPGQREIGSWTLGHSRTFEVGSRQTGKMMRAYEKGDEKLGPEADDPWIRYEVEFRDNHRIIDLDVLTRPSDFFAGAYEFCADMLEQLRVNANACRIPTVPEVADKTEEAAVLRVARWIKRTAAPALSVALSLGGDLLGQILDQEGHRMPKRLRGIKTDALRSAFEKVAEAMAPASSPSLSGAV